MNDDEKALLQAQATILAGILVAEARVNPERRMTEDEMIEDAQRMSHILAQNLDLNSGKP